ncbi:MAG: thioredoxin domain-containing protein [bacterium]
MTNQRALGTCLTLIFLINSVACTAQEDSHMQTVDPEHSHTNHLIDENSPYLLSHAHNPVDWYPWGEAALAKARTQDKPIFLSIGYAACHWCHVMERESFENQEIADILNRGFVAIKVDREQRPDLDQIYMSFTTAMTGSGGWPMSVFLTPDLKPFFAGTYFPAVESYGRPSFKRVVSEIERTYRQDKANIIESAEGIFAGVTSRLTDQMPPTVLTSGLLSRAASELMAGFDNTYGGFGQAPKFPHATELRLFLRHYRQSGDLTFLSAANKALTAMARGGIYDQLGGGFARYATDREWLAPHFEKMLYDNGLLIPLYVEGYQITGDSLYLRVVRETLDWMLREMAGAEGGFYSALDADSEGEEGKFYVWQKSEIDRILGPEAAAFYCRHYDISSGGNWEHQNILRLTTESDRQAQQMDPDVFERLHRECREKVFKARSARVRPLTDDKVLTSWNGLAVSALARGFQITGEQRYLDAALKNASFAQSTLCHDGRLTHAWREGVHSDGQFLEDYAFYLQGLIDLYESDSSPTNDSWLRFAIELADTALDLFQDDSGRLFLRPQGHDDLIMRPVDEQDGALPAPGSYLISALFRLGRLTGEPRYQEKAELALGALSGQINQRPSSFSSAVMANDYHLSEKVEIIIVGHGRLREAMLSEVYGRYLPNRVIAGSADGESSWPLFEGRQSSSGSTTTYICKNNVCGLPATNIKQLRTQLADL